MRQKLSNYVAAFLKEAGVRQVFCVSGGASIHIMHGIAATPGIDVVCCHHEQAAAMAADGYARVTGNIGCAVSTSGPGATNMITGIAGAWFDSVPVLYLTGQVTTFRLKGALGVRQFGFQETEIVPMVAPVTKYAVQLRAAKDIRFELEKALFIAKSGRPGPVLIDIPDDIQRSIVETEALVGFTHDVFGPETPTPSSAEIDQAIALLSACERPVLVLGQGVRLAGAVDEAIALAEAWRIPVLTSWGAKDFLAGGHRLNAGTFGTHGTRAGNFTIQNADLVLAIGARLSTRETGDPLKNFARGARLIVVDIDPSELRKFGAFGRLPDVAICADAKRAIRALAGAGSLQRDWSQWHARIGKWQSRYPSVAMKGQPSEPYMFMRRLAEKSSPETQFFFDTGCAVAWAMQGMSLRGKQRFFHDFNNTAMGWAIPAALAGALARPDVPTVCVVGDGSFMMNMQELATIAYHKLPIKIILLDNRGYAMCRQTEQQWLDGVHVGSSTESGLGFPDFNAMASAFGFAVLDEHAAFKEAEGPVFVRVPIDEAERVVPQVKFGYPIEDGAPHLPRHEFLANMIVKPLPVSLAFKPTAVAS